MLEGDSKSLDAGLTYLVDKINVLTPQASLEFRSEEHKKRFLRKAVLHANWALTPITQMTTARFTFNRVVTALREQIQTTEERRATMSNTTGTFFGQYGVHLKSLKYRSRSHRPQYSGKQIPVGRDGRRMLCHTCGSDSHLLRQHNVATGDKYANLRNGVVRSLNNGTSAVHVLSEVMNSLQDEQLVDDEESDDPDNTSSHLSEVEEFQSLTEPHADGNTIRDEEDAAVMQFVDETQALGRMAADMSSRPTSVAVAKKGKVRFADNPGFGKGV